MRRPFSAPLLALLCPGAGHLYLRDTARGLAFSGLIAFLFLTGLKIGGELDAPRPERGVFHLLASAASLGSGLISWLALLQGGHGDPRSATYEEGSGFILTAGLLNLLLVIDAAAQSSLPRD